MFKSFLNQSHVGKQSVARKSILFLFTLGLMGTAVAEIAKTLRPTKPKLFSLSKVHAPPCQNNVQNYEKFPLVSKGFEAFKEKQLIAQDAEMRVYNSTNTKLVARTYQSFVEKNRSYEPQIVCGQSLDHAFRYSMTAPTWIDRHQKNPSYWQFQIHGQEGELAAWNKKSSLLSNLNSVKTLSEAHIFKLNHKQFAAVFRKSNKHSTQELIIRYEVN